MAESKRAGRGVLARHWSGSSALPAGSCLSPSTAPCTPQGHGMLESEASVLASLLQQLQRDLEVSSEASGSVSPAFAPA
jgi:hypothetical protein